MASSWRVFVMFGVVAVGLMLLSAWPGGSAPPLVVLPTQTTAPEPDEPPEPALFTIDDETAPPTTTRRRVTHMTLETLIPREPWRNPNRLSRVETPRADFRRRLVPSSWDVIDTNGTLPEPGTLQLEFHEGVAGEQPDWVGLNNGCESSGWLIDWLEGEGDIGLIRRVAGRIHLGDSDCPDPAPVWPFPKGWVRVSFDGDQLILGRKQVEIVAERTDVIPVNPVELPSPDGPLRRQLLYGLWEYAADYDGRRQPALAIEAGHPDWIHTFDGCTRRSTWIREWTDTGFIAESRPQPLSMRSIQTEARSCPEPTNGMEVLHSGPVDVVITDGGLELISGDLTFALTRRW